MNEITNSWKADLPASESQELLMAVKDQIEKDIGKFIIDYGKCKKYFKKKNKRSEYIKIT